MDRNVALFALVTSVCGTLAVLAGLWGARGDGGGDGSGQELERACWRALWLPLLPAIAALALLTGWAAQEPGRTDELVRPLAALIALPVSLIWTRVVWRAVRALRVPPATITAAVVGLWRPRVVISDRLRRAVDPAALEAALAHERAHVRHRDPLRLWLAQLAADLQWPGPGAARRLAAWASALELARDEEARHQGARGEDLAAVIVSAARLHAPGSRAGLAVFLTGVEQALVLRLARLLRPLDPLHRSNGHGRRLGLLLAAATVVVAATWCGLCHGDAVVRALPIVRS